MNKYFEKFVECRYLALVAALATEADFVFIPEWPPERGWDTKMCKKLLQASIINFLLQYIFIFFLPVQYDVTLVNFQKNFQT